MRHAKLAPTPGTGQELASQPTDAIHLDDEDIKHYQSIVGALMYLVNTTRWDISFAVLGLSRGMARPTQQHMVGAKRVLRYLKGELDMPTVYRSGSLKLEVYCDSNCGTSPEKSRSCTGLICPLGGSVVSSSAKHQQLTAQSTKKAELIAFSNAAREGIYMTNLLGELGVESKKSLIYSDSTGALHLAGNATFSGRTKHTSPKYYMMRDWIDNGRISIHHVPGTLQLGDLLTKHLARPMVQRLKDMIQTYESRITPSTGHQ